LPPGEDEAAMQDANLESESFGSLVEAPTGPY